MTLVFMGEASGLGWAVGNSKTGRGWAAGGLTPQLASNQKSNRGNNILPEVPDIFFITDS
jgi:hypothetical protein